MTAISRLATVLFILVFHDSASGDDHWQKCLFEYCHDLKKLFNQTSNECSRILLALGDFEGVTHAMEPQVKDRRVFLGICPDSDLQLKRISSHVVHKVNILPEWSPRTVLSTFADLELKRANALPDRRPEVYTHVIQYGRSTGKITTNLGRTLLHGQGNEIEQMQIGSQLDTASLKEPTHVIVMFIGRCDVDEPLRLMGVVSRTVVP
ncbi:hypothetical protein [Planctopirus hydrillae]|nr:hypothetical protein [Planctopirus hydrillae]